MSSDDCLELHSLKSHTVELNVSAASVADCPEGASCAARAQLTAALVDGDAVTRR